MKCKHCGANIYLDHIEYLGAWYNYPTYKTEYGPITASNRGYYCPSRVHYSLGHEPEEAE